MRPRMERLRALLAASALLIAAIMLPAPAGAEHPSAWIAPGGGVLWIPDELPVKSNAPMFGALFGVRIADALALEARGMFASSDDRFGGTQDLSLYHADGSLTWFLRSEGIRPYLMGSAGIVALSIEDSSDTKFAWGGGLGFSIPLSSKIALRLEGREILYKVYVPSAGQEKFKHGPEAFAGISFGFGGAPSDADGDGVPEKSDHCPNTPMGARVDASGCPIDGDQDGVPDGLDRCDGTPRGATVDATGCPSDADQDGVVDGLDTCPDTPAGARVSATGCPLDGDKDGVPDGLDQCEGTAAGCTVNANGCHADQDQDGVCDGVDRCPDTPATARIDAQGCPIEVSERETELLETGMIRLQDVNFDTGKAIIKPESFRALDEVGDILTTWPELRIEIAGHTDSRGTDATNLALSEARAKAVRDYLLQTFPDLKADQFTARGYGERQPIASNTTQLGMARNRRVEFKVLNTEALRRQRERRQLAPK